MIVSDVSVPGIQIFPSGYLLLTLPPCSFPYFWSEVPQKCQSQSRSLKHRSHPQCFVYGFDLYFYSRSKVACRTLQAKSFGFFFFIIFFKIKQKSFYTFTKLKLRQIIKSCQANGFTLFRKLIRHRTKLGEMTIWSWDHDKLCQYAFPRYCEYPFIIFVMNEWINK